MTRHMKLMGKAREVTGLDNFGEGSFVDGLERLLWSLDNEAKLTEFGSAALDDQLLDLLCRRLEVEQCFAAHPEIDDEQIVAPLIGLGLPRTGSTAFSCLLAEDPSARYPRHWEIYAPCPPPEAMTQYTDPRIAKSEAILDISYKMFPGFKSMLPTSAVGPTECQQLMGHDFKSAHFAASARIPSYSKWLFYEADLVSTYRYLKRMLKMFQWHCPPKRWRLKNPNHCLFLPALNSVFPDAKFWMTHRDVAQVLPSVCNMYELLSHVYTDNVDKTSIARGNVEWTDLGMRRVMEFRDRDRQDHRFFDVQFEEFQSNPLPSIENLYAFLGEELTANARHNMEQWWQQSSREKGERPNYSLTGFDLDFQDLNRRFDDYSKRFSVLVRTPSAG